MRLAGSQSLARAAHSSAIWNSGLALGPGHIPRNGLLRGSASQINTFNFLKEFRAAFHDVEPIPPANLLLQERRKGCNFDTQEVLVDAFRYALHAVFHCRD